MITTTTSSSISVKPSRRGRLRILASLRLTYLSPWPLSYFGRRGKDRARRSYESQERFFMRPIVRPKLLIQLSLVISAQRPTTHAAGAAALASDRAGDPEPRGRRRAG